MIDSRTILIVDDRPEGQIVLEDLLANGEYNLIFASNGPEALQKASEFMPDLILLDVMMPGMDGFEVCRRLRADPELAEVPVLMITVLDDSESRLHGIASGADDFIARPFNRAELSARVKTIMRLNRYRRLREQDARFAWVVEHSDDGYLVISTDDTILYANARSRELLGIDEHEPIVGSFLELARVNYQFEPESAWSGWPLNLQDRPVSRYLVGRRGSAAVASWLHVDIQSPSTRDRLVRLRDISGEMALQRDIWSFHAAVYHKLRTPLISIVGGLEVLYRHAIRAPITDDLVTFVATALKGAHRLQSEIEDVLKFVSIDSDDEAGSAFVLGDLERLVNQISATLELKPPLLSLPDNANELRLSLTSKRMELVLWELLENSQKFHPEGQPVVDIEAQLVDPGVVLLRVRDDGVVIPTNQLARLWEPYYQGEQRFTGEVPGMGLGMALVATLVWECGGSCRVSNRTGQAGVVVELALPLAH